MGYLGLTPMGHPSTWEPRRVAPFAGYSGMIQFLKSLQAANDDAIVMIDGPEGAGKSTVGLRAMRHLDSKWNPETGLIIDYEDWEEVYDLESGRVFLLDEGGDLLFSRDSQTRESKLIVRIFQMSRIFNHVIVILCPNIHWVDLYIRDHRALIYGHVHKQYHALGVHRGLVTWNWPKRYFDWKHSEWVSRWDNFAASRFKPIRKDSEFWVQYEKVKRMKVQKRQLDLEMTAQQRRKR